jgi:hypothetical protein
MTMVELVYTVEGDKVLDEYSLFPLPVRETTHVVLLYPEAMNFWITVTIETDLFFEQFNRNGGCVVDPDGATHQYYFAYIANRLVVYAVESTEQRVGKWLFIPGEGLVLEGETDLLEEMRSVGSDILRALHQGDLGHTSERVVH